MFRRDSLTPERTEELVERIAQAVVRAGFEDPIKLILLSFRGVSYFFGQQGLFFVSPYITFLVGQAGEDFFLLIQERENVNRLVDRIDELAREKKKSEKESKPKKKGFLKRLREKFK